jgi:hypothetical protein
MKRNDTVILAILVLSSTLLGAILMYAYEHPNAKVKFSVTILDK